MFKNTEIYDRRYIEKNLFMLISLYIFSKESEFSQNETNPAQLETLKDEYRMIIERLNKLMEEGKLSDLDRTTLLETVVSLSLKKDTPKIEISLQPEEDSLYEPKDKGTYGKIKTYILEKHGLKVSSLYMAQVKDKCGLDKQRNYNLSEKEDAHVPKCLKEKEDAIMDVFGHFGLL